MIFPRSLLAVLGLPLALVCANAAEPVAPEPALIAKLPPDLGAAASRWLHLDAKMQAGLLAMDAGSLDREVMLSLAAEPDAIDFVLGRMASEPVRTDELILKVAQYEPSWALHAHAAEGLRALAAATPDTSLMLEYLDTARRLEVKQLRADLRSRLGEARRKGDAAAVSALQAADERWLLLERGAMLPSFLRASPAVFEVKPPADPIRVIGFGDFGFTGSAGQRQVAAAMARMNSARPFDFGITFGDNFYPSGMNSPTDSRWKDMWEACYGVMGIAFYPSLGNHEWYSDEGAVSEILYKSPSWRFPAPYYTFTAGPVQFFAIDTTDVSEAQADWLTRQIGASHSAWKVVYGHHPIFAPVKSAKGTSEMHRMQEQVWPLIQGKVDAYLCGHEHAQAHMDARDGVHFYMSGGGGAPLGSVSKKVAGTHFAESTFGFLGLEADAKSLKVTIYDGDGTALDSETLSK